MNKYKYIKTLIVSAAVLLGVSCSTAGEETPSVDEYGTLNLAGLTVGSAEMSRAVSTDDFLLRIWNESEELVAEWVMSQRPEEIRLKAGPYVMEVCSPELEDAAWESPWYVGMSGVDIVKNDTATPVSVTCVLGNIKVTVEYSDDLLARSDDAEAVVAVGEGSLTYGHDERRAGYFRASDEPLDMTVTFTATIDGMMETTTKIIEGVKAGGWETVRIGFEEVQASGKGGLTINPVVGNR